MKKSTKEALDWWDQAVAAGWDRATYRHGEEQIGKNTGDRTLTCNDFLCGVEWVLKHQPIPRAYKKANGK